MELQIGRVARIPGAVLPHAGGGLEVTAEDRHRPGGVSTPPVYPVRLIRGMALVVRRAVLELVGGRQEVADATGGEDAVNTLPLGGAEPVYPFYRGRPVRRGPVGALREPKPLRPGAEVPLITGSAEFYLRPHAGVEAEQRQIGVGRGGGEHLYVPLLL